MWNSIGKPVIMIATYHTRSFPYIFTLLVIGFATVTGISQTIDGGDTKDAATYIALTFGGVWIMMLAKFLKDSMTITIFHDRLKVENRFYPSEKTIYFDEIETFNHKKTIIPAGDHLERRGKLVTSRFISNGTRNSDLVIVTKDGDKTLINMNDFDERDEIWKMLRKESSEYLTAKFFDEKEAVSN